MLDCSQCVYRVLYLNVCICVYVVAFTGDFGLLNSALNFCPCVRERARVSVYVCVFIVFRVRTDLTACAFHYKHW